MKSKFQETKDLLHSLSRSVSVNLIQEADLTSREKDILISHELEKSMSIKELASKYGIEERSLLKAKQKAMAKLCYWLHNFNYV